MAAISALNKNSDEIVISGMSGLFPASKNIDEFEFNLYNKIDMVDDAETRFQHTNPRIPRLCGKIKDITSFDSELFNIPAAIADDMDPQARYLLEEAIKAILDAGVNPETLKGTKTGVYIGCSIVESEELMYGDNNNQNFLFGTTGCRKSVLASRISYHLGLIGPAMCCDTACSSSIYALDTAMNALRSGEIDAAIVGGANLCLHVNITLQFALLGVLSANGRCRSFDADADGYCRSEAIGCFFLQRESKSKRIYATIVDSKTNCDGFKLEGISYPSHTIQEKLLREVYAQGKIDLEDIGFLEAHSTATVAGDPMECKAIDAAIAQRRSTPLPVGSVKSNCGHGEPAAGVCSMVKVLLTMNNDVIPPNINYKTFRPNIEGLRSGRMVVVAEPTKLAKPIIGVNSFGFGGANAHVILRQFPQLKTTSKFYNNLDNKLPRLVTWSARTENAVDIFLNALGNQPLDFEFIALAHGAQQNGLKGFNARGYALLQPTDENTPPVLLEKKILIPTKLNRKIVWIFSGIGGHWHTMGRSLLKLKLFEQSIAKFDRILKPLGLNLRTILEASTRSTWHNIVESFVEVTAVHLALIDVLKALGVKADFLIGLSIGEFACAYADGCLTAEQAILASYYCGRVIKEKVQTTSAAVLVRHKLQDVEAMCPKGGLVAAELTQTACVVSGPSDEIASFVSLLNASNIYTEILEGVNIAYHTKQIAEVSAELISQLKKVIVKPKLRSNRWISTSLSVDDWFNKAKPYASAEYFANNLQGQVNFEQTFPFIPSNALVVDFGPPVLQRSIWEKKKVGDYVKLMPAQSEGDVSSFLKTIGDLYLQGIDVAVDIFYPKVEFPVSRGTRCLSPLIEFDHKHNFPIYNCEKNLETRGSKVFCVTYNQHDWLMGHEIDGRVLLPATFYLECVWRTLSGMCSRKSLESLAVEFRNVKFERATTFAEGNTLELLVIIHFGSGRFEITENEGLVVSGYVKAIKNSVPAVMESSDETASPPIMICQKDFYKELKLRGYHYNGEFRGVMEASTDGSRGQIKWKNNWTTFMDCVLQMSIIGHDSRTLQLPTRIRRLRIYPSYHIANCKNNTNVSVQSNGLHKRIVAGGIEVIGLDATSVGRRRYPAEPVLEAYQFIPHFPAPKLSLTDISRCCIQIVLENQPRQHMQIVELASAETADSSTFLEHLSDAVSDLPLITGNYALVYDIPKSNETHEHSARCEINCYYADEDFSSIKPNILVFAQDTKSSGTIKSNLIEALDNKEFIIIRDRSNQSMEKFSTPPNFEMAAYFPAASETYVLLIKVLTSKNETTPEIFDISQSTGHFNWLKPLQELCELNSQVILLAQSDQVNGIMGLTNCLRKEPKTKDVRCVFIDDKNCAPFDLKSPLFANQLKRTLALNVYKKGCWGTYRHLKIKEEYPLASPKTHAYGHMSQVGDIQSLKWYRGPLTDETADVKIVYASLNFRDVMQATGRLRMYDSGKGRLNQNCIFGIEYSGIEAKTGKRVMGMTVKGAISTHLREPHIFQFDVPDSWTLLEAATIPVVYITVYYAFFFVGYISKGKSILIHSGSGGVGLAAIRVAQAYGMEVFTTVSTKEKTDFILKTFPKLKACNIGNSRDNSFEQMIMEQTGGKGVDFVLNSLSEDKLKTSVRCLATNGHFLEIGKYDMSADNSIQMGTFLNGITFSSVLADIVLQTGEEVMRGIRQQMEDDIKKGIIQPLPVTVFESEQIEPAFRYLMSGKHKGKIAIQIRKDEMAAPILPISLSPQIYFESSQVYIIAGGLGGFGLELVDWMILRGARLIVLSSSRGLTSDYQKLRISLWKSYCCQVVINTADIATTEGCQALLADSMKLGPVGGIFNLAVILQDAVFQNQTIDQFEKSFKPKAFATIHLDQLSRQLCPDLKHFVIFSSVSCGRGNAGQTNYGMANSIMERIIENRVASGLPGKAVQWGAVGEVGLVAEMAAGKIDLEIGGTLQQRISSCLQVLDVLFMSTDAVVSSMVVAEKKANASGQTPLEYVLATLSIRDIKTISMTAKLSELGLDSLTGVEIRQTFETDYGIVLNTSDLRALTIEKLAEISENTGAASSAPKNKERLVTVDHIEHIRHLVGQITDLLTAKGSIEKICPIDSGTPIMVLPGIEGSGGSVWSNIGEKLKTPVYIIKYHEMCDATNIEQIIQFCLEHITECMRSHKCKTFQIIGYSMGCLLAHKVIAILESQGIHGKVLCIDGSPVFVQKVISSVQQVYKDIELEKIAMSVLLSLLLPTLQLETIERDIRLKFTKEEISTYLWDQLKAHNYPNISDSMSKVEGICRRLNLIQPPDIYSNMDTIDAEIMLLKPTELVAADLDDHYGLSLLTRSQVETKTLEGNHQTILHNESLPDIINEFFMS